VRVPVVRERDLDRDDAFDASDSSAAASEAMRTNRRPGGTRASAAPASIGRRSPSNTSTFGGRRKGQLSIRQRRIPGAAASKASVSRSPRGKNVMRSGVPKDAARAWSSASFGSLGSLSREKRKVISNDRSTERREEASRRSATSA